MKKHIPFLLAAAALGYEAMGESHRTTYEELLAQASAKRKEIEQREAEKKRQRRNRS